MPLPNLDQSDWEWIKNQAAADTPVPYDPSDADDGPYDPNDDESVDRFLTDANRIHPTAPKNKGTAAKAS